MENIKVLIDPGHYGKTVNKSPCLTNPVYYESQMAWTLSNYLKRDLESYGIEVGFTRETIDEDLGVVERGEKAKGYDLFLSIHSNAVGYDVCEGVDRPVIIAPILADKNVLSLADKLGSEIQSVMGTKQKYQIYQKEYPNKPTVDYYGTSRGAVSVGCKYAYTLECGFHTDTACTTWLLKDANLQRLAKHIAKVVADWYDIKKKENAQSKNTIYRVQVGAFTQKVYADAMLKEIKEKGYPNAYVVTEEV